MVCYFVCMKARYVKTSVSTSLRQDYFVNKVTYPNKNLILIFFLIYSDSF